MKRPRLLAGAIALTAALAACSSGGGTPNASSPPAPSSSNNTPATSAPAPPTTSAAADAASGVSGTWSGQYSGAFTGTFKLHWRQSGTTLSGSITLSNPGSTVPINGKVNGSSISFGTVGSEAITYSGSVSGSSMSGNYQVKSPSGAATGTWSASKSG